MLRFYNASHDVTIPTREEPPRPQLVPRARVLARPPTRALATATQFDSGREPAFTVRFASTETIGLLEHDTVEALIAMYEDGGAFSVDTDLLGPPGHSTETFDALWDEASVPQFPIAANGQRYYMDLAVRLTRSP